MIDRLLAFKILSMIVTPFDKTDAFKFGIVDAEGKLLRKVADLTGDEAEAYNPLVRLVFNIKRLIGKLPGGESKIKNISSAYFLVKENLDADASEESLMEQYFDMNREVTLVDETVEVLQFLEDAPANATGAAVSTDEPVIKPRKKKEAAHDANMVRTTL